MYRAITITDLSDPDDFESLQTSTIYSYTLINDAAPANNWEAAKAAGICTGTGTAGDPYVIRDDIFEYGSIGPGHCLEIRNSRKYFRILSISF